MLKEKRHELLVSYIKKNGSARVEDLIKVTKTAPITVRRDLQELHDEGRVLKVHGGAVLIETERSKEDVLLKTRASEAAAEKLFIAEKAAKHITEGAHIFLDAGTTTSYLIPFLKDKHVKVYTHGIHHIADLSLHEIDSYVIGGQLKNSTMATIGEETLRAISQLHFDFAFVGANAVDDSFGYSTPDISEAIIKEAIIGQSQHAFILADASKLDQKSYVSFAKKTDAILITNEV